jgi:ankyrin repeat protein
VAPRDGLALFFLRSLPLIDVAARCVKVLLDGGADINLADRNGSTPLHVACFIGGLASVKELVKRGANLTLVDERGHDCLHKACFSGSERIVQFLLQSGAELNSTDASKRSCLHIAALLGKAKALAVLLESGLKLELRDSNNFTALHCAASANQVQSLQALLSHKADIAAKDWAGRTALHLAASIGAEGCVALLLAQGAAVDALDDDRCTPLHHAAFNGHVDVVAVLLSNKADPEAVDSSGTGALAKACWKGHMSVVEQLLYDSKHRSLTLDHGAIRKGLVAAAAGGAVEVVDYLLDQKVAIDSIWDDGYTALTKAAFFGKIEVVKLLVTKYKAPLSKGPHLHAAAHAGHEAIVRFLLENKCAVDARDDEGGTPLHCAAYNGHLSCCLRLLEAGAVVGAIDKRGTTALHTAARNGHVEVLRLLLDRQSDSSSLKSAVNTPDHLGMRPLHHAVGHPKCVELLIESGFPLDDQDATGSTPLHRAVSMNKATDATALIRAGASLELKDKQGRTPLSQDHSMREALTDVLAARARLSNIHQFEKAVTMFNEKPKTAIAFLREHGLVREGEQQGAADIAEFLGTAKDLNKQQLGEFISDPGEFAALILQNFLSRFHFTGQTLEQAVRTYLVTFRLPGEAQRIDRVMQGFASRFHHDNPDMFSHEDTAYLLAFSMIMLQTDAHNPAIKREKKMTKQQFIMNNRRIDQGRDLPEAMLGEIYDNIITTPIKMESGVQMTLEVVETAGMLKIRSEKSRWAKQWVVLRENCLYYHLSEKDRQPQGIIPLENLTVRKLSSSPLLFEILCAQAQEGLFVKACKMESGMLVPDNVVWFQFEASAEQEADQWCAKIRSSIIGNPVRELMAQRRSQLERHQQSAMRFGETASSHLGPQLQLALQMCVAASKGADVVQSEYPGALVRDPHGMLRYYVITNETSKSHFVVLSSNVWRDLDECESWEQSPTAGKLFDMCQAIRRNKREDAVNSSPLSGYPYRNMARKAFDLLCDDLKQQKEYGLFVVAHGISAPLAPIIARALMRQDFKVRKVLTFGQPAIFSQRGAEKHSRLPYFRMTHQRDIVPCLFPGFLHAGTEIMVFEDGSVAIVPRTEHEESKGLAAKVISTTMTRARQLVDMTMASKAAGSDESSSPPMSPVKGKGGSLAQLQMREQQRPSFANSPSALSGPPAAVVQKTFQDLLWEENRINTYVGLLKDTDQKEVVLFDSKRNEL